MLTVYEVSIWSLIAMLQKSRCYVSDGEKNKILMFLLRISGTRGFWVFSFYFLKHWDMLMFMKGKFRVLWHCSFTI